MYIPDIVGSSALWRRNGGAVDVEIHGLYYYCGMYVPVLGISFWDYGTYRQVERYHVSYVHYTGSTT